MSVGVMHGLCGLWLCLEWCCGFGLIISAWGGVSRYMHGGLGLWICKLLEAFLGVLSGFIVNRFIHTWSHSVIVQEVQCEVKLILRGIATYSSVHIICRLESDSSRC